MKNFTTNIPFRSALIILCDYIQSLGRKEITEDQIRAARVKTDALNLFNNEIGGDIDRGVALWLTLNITDKMCSPRGLMEQLIRTHIININGKVTDELDGMTAEQAFPIALDLIEKAEAGAVPRNITDILSQSIYPTCSEDTFLCYISFYAALVLNMCTADETAILYDDMTTQDKYRAVMQMYPCVELPKKLMMELDEIMSKEQELTPNEVNRAFQLSAAGYPLVFFADEAYEESNEDSEEADEDIDNEAGEAPDCEETDVAEEDAEKAGLPSGSGKADKMIVMYEMMSRMDCLNIFMYVFNYINNDGKDHIQELRDMFRGKASDMIDSDMRFFNMFYEKAVKVSDDPHSWTEDFRSELDSAFNMILFYYPYVDNAYGEKPEHLPPIVQFGLENDLEMNHKAFFQMYNYICENKIKIEDKNDAENLDAAVEIFNKLANNERITNDELFDFHFGILSAVQYYPGVVFKNDRLRDMVTYKNITPRTMLLQLIFMNKFILSHFLAPFSMHYRKFVIDFLNKNYTLENIDDISDDDLQLLNYAYCTALRFYSKVKSVDMNELDIFPPLVYHSNMQTEELHKNCELLINYAYSNAYYIYNEDIEKIKAYERSKNSPEETFYALLKYYPNAVRTEPPLIYKSFDIDSVCSSALKKAIRIK